MYTFEILGIKNLFSLLNLKDPKKKKHKKGILKLTPNKESPEENVSTFETAGSRYTKIL